MSIEDDLLNALKYAGFDKKIDPTKMVETLAVRIQTKLLEEMKARIDAKLAELRVFGASTDESLDPFKILGVNINCTREEADKAYRAKSHTAHPDLGGSDIEMAKVNAAYETICMFKGWKTK